MRYASILNCDICNGTYFGVSLFVQGCHFHCKNCFNKSAWDFNGGKEFTQDTMNYILELLKKPYIKRFTLLGGEPLAEENIDCVCNIAKIIKDIYGDSKMIWCYTGYTFDEVKDKEIMKYIDVIVDGKYIDEKRDITLAFRGSSNQNIIEVKK